MSSLTIRFLTGLILLLCIAQSQADPLPSVSWIEQAIHQRDVSTGEILARIERFKLNFPSLPDVTRRHILASEAEALIEAASYDAARVSLAELQSAAEAAHDEADQAIVQILRARLAYHLNDVPAQLEAARLAVAQASSLKRPDLIGMARQSLGVALFKHGQNEEAARVLDQALNDAREARDPVLEGRVYWAMGLMNVSLYDNRRALQYVHEAQRVLRPQRQEWLLASLLGIEAIVGGSVVDGSEKYPLLIETSKRAHALGLPQIERYALINLSDWHLIHKEWAQAIDVARSGLAVSVPDGDALGEGMLKLNLGQALFSSGRSREGLASLLGACAQLRTLTQQNYVLMALTELAKSYERLGRYRESLAAMKEYKAIQDTLARTQRTAQVAELQEKFDSDRRQREITRLLFENQVASSEAEHHRFRAMLLSVLALVLILAFAAGAWMFRRTRRANTELAAANARLAFLAERDSLTGLFNRRAMHAWLESLPRVSAENPVGMVLLDIDYFKAINDQYGHEVGDRVLVEVAHRLGSLLREGDRLARWGGEEFLIVLPGMATHAMEAFVDRILKRICAEDFRVSKESLRVTVSVGFCPLHAGMEEDGGSWDSCFMLSDLAMYHAKSQGRSGACGVLAFRAPWDAIRSACLRDFSAAIQDGLIEVRHWHGFSPEAPHLVPFVSRLPAA